MITTRKSADRGHFDHGWLDARHTFSFAGYQDPNHMGFRTLRVINEDVVQPGQGFGTHGHQDMEIITAVVEGALEHKDSTGGGSVLRAGEFQRMTAGTGITHSEFNHSADERAHFLQIWILPEQQGLPPGYEQRPFPVQEQPNRLHLVASPDGRDGSLKVHQDAQLFAGALEAGAKLEHALAAGRHAWVQVVKGGLTVGDAALAAGDGAAVSDETELSLSAGDAGAELLVFDLA